jgi:hypothetical protein
MNQLVKLLRKILFSNASLTKVDSFYRNTVSSMPFDYKVNYCESLIFRTYDDINLCRCVIKKRKLKKLVKISKAELKKLKSI